MIDIASDCAKRTSTIDLGRNRCAKPRYFLLCPQGKPAWYSAAELDHVPIAIPEHRELIRHWLQASTAETALALQAPWVNQGWFDDAAAWIQAQLAQRHITALGPIVQERVWALSCVMRLETSIGDVYFKAVPPFMTQESVAMHEVSRQYPDLLPPPLALDTGRGWMLMPDFGGDSLLHVPDLSRWQEVLRLCAHMQVEQARYVDDWLARGIPDRRLHRMVQLTEPLMTLASRLLSGSPPGCRRRKSRACTPCRCGCNYAAPSSPPTAFPRPSSMAIWAAIFSYTASGIRSSTGLMCALRIPFLS
jgi:hypothetical protein